MSFKRATLCFGFLAFAFAARPASATTACKVDSECGKGFICQLVSTTEPSPPPTRDPVGPTASDAAKVAPAPGASYPAPPATSGYCIEGPCKLDADCGAGMVCHSEKVKACSGGTTPAIACAPNSKCAQPTPTDPVCTESTVSQCMFKWQLPCSTDTECGAGFQCAPSVSATCSGGSGVSTPGSTGGGTPSSGGSSAGSGGATGSSGATAPSADLAPPDHCTTMTSFPGWCQPKTTTCAVDAECPTSWTCAATVNTSSSPSAGPGVPVGSSAGSGGATSSDPTAPPSGAPVPILPPPAAKACMSPLGTFDARDAGVGQNGGGTTTSTPGGTPKGDEGSEDPTAPPSPMASPTAGHGGPGATNNEGTPGGGTSLASNGGCAVGGGAGGSPLALLGFAALGVLVARRRRS